MVRVKRGVTSLKRRRNVLKQAKGYRWGAKSKERLARQTLLHAGKNAFAGRKLKKRTARGLWQTKISAAVKPRELSYSRFMDMLKKNNIELDRKVLSQIAEHYPETFESLITRVK